MALFDDIAEFESTTSSAFGSRFAGLWVAHRPTFAVVVATNGADAGLVLSLAQGTTLEGFVLHRRVAMTLAELEDLARRVRAADSTVDIDIDIRENRVDVMTLSESATSTRIRDQILEFPSGVVVREVQALSAPAADIYGGLSLSNGCTSGFSVRNSAGTTGIVTANHCNNTQAYNGTNLPWVAGRQFGNTDAQWHTTPGLTDAPKIKTGSTTTRTITGQSTYSGVAVGVQLCKYGTSTGWDCGELTTKNFNPSWVNKGTQFGRITNCSVDMSTPGDSGGPVVMSSSAVGVISGYYSDIFCANDQNIFGFMEFVQTHLGISVVTN